MTALDDPWIDVQTTRCDVHQGSKTSFYEDIREGRFPQPDCYLSERKPVWLKSTLTKWQREKLAAAKRKPVAAE
jgi:predicted DNA-binding transcriptional regulator AlpA